MVSNWIQARLKISSWNTLPHLGPAYQAGTMRNPLSMRAGIALLEVLEQNGVYERLDH